MSSVESVDDLPTENNENVEETATMVNEASNNISLSGNEDEQLMEQLPNENVEEMAAMVNEASNNISLSGNEDEQLMEQLRGDAIGNTLFSESFLLKAIIELLEMIYTNEKVNSDLETKLCTVWDMTVEPDVIEYFLSKDLLPLLYDIIYFSNDMRVTEITLGIIGNLCINVKVFDNLSSNACLPEELLKLLTVMDSGMLLQLMRVFEVIISHLKADKLDHCNKWYEHICGFKDVDKLFGFIMATSSNVSLIRATMKTVFFILSKFEIISDSLETLAKRKLVEIEFPTFANVFVGAALIEGTTEAFNFLMDHQEEIDNLEIFDLYIGIHVLLSQHQKSRREYSFVNCNVMKCLAKVLSTFNDSSMETLPLTERQERFINNISHICICLDKPFHCEFFINGLKVWYILKSHSNQSKCVSELNNTSKPPTGDYSKNCQILLDLLANSIKSDSNIELLNKYQGTSGKELDAFLTELNTEENRSKFPIAFQKLTRLLSAPN